MPWGSLVPVVSFPFSGDTILNCWGYDTEMPPCKFSRFVPGGSLDPVVSFPFNRGYDTELLGGTILHWFSAGITILVVTFIHTFVEIPD